MSHKLQQLHLIDGSCRTYSNKTTNCQSRDKTGDGR